MKVVEKVFIKFLFILRNIYSKIKKSRIKVFPPDSSHEQANELIKGRLLSEAPVMICRFGASELFSLVTYANMQKGFEKYLEYIKGEIDTFWYNEKGIKEEFLNCGLFPINQRILSRFYELMMKDINCVDILGTWLKEEAFFAKELSHVVKVRLQDLEPYYHSNPWSEVLEGKKVLVIHPFEESIKKQYSKRELLFDDKRVLPAFELKTIKAVQSLGNSSTGFNDWFEPLDSMKDKIRKTDFDIAIIGCGAYGFPLAAYVKSIGKKAIHLGGATQALFGITGKRWEENEVAKFINEHWSTAFSEDVSTTQHYLTKHGYI
jgi:hypothetical protein